MALNNLDSSIAAFRASLITLRDDHTRLGNLLSGDSLTTVMGPAANAGVKEATLIVATLRANAVLQAMTKDSGNQEQLFAWLADAIQETQRDAGKAAVEKATDVAKAQYVEQLNTLNARNETTVVALEAASKMLLSGAEAKANIITRKREEAEARYVTSLELVKLKITLITKLDKRQESMSADLDAVSGDPDVDSEDMYRRVAQISNGQKAMANQKEIAVQCMVNHFGDQTTLTKSAKTDLVSLKIPEDIEQGKGTELMTNFEMYIIGRSEQFYALMPYLQRVLEDYDHATGACYKPPCLKESIVDIPEAIRGTYASQSKALYGAIMNKLSESVSCLVKATFEYGIDEKPTLCAEHDGPNLLFALICMFRPCNVEYTEQLESLFIDAHNKFPGADPRDVIKALRGPLIEAQNLQMAFKWRQSGKRIVDQLVHNDHNMTEALKAFKKLDVADKDSTAQLDKLFAAVEAQCKRNDKHDGKASAFSTRLLSHGEPDTAGKPARDTSKVKCRFGAGCTRWPGCGYMHSEDEVRSLERLGKGSRTNNGGKGGKGRKASGEMCMAVGCPDKASKRKKVCTTCYMKACEEGEIKLNDGTVFTGSNPRHEQTVGILTKGKMQDLKKAFAAIVGEDESSDDDDAPTGVGGPACSAKRKRAAVATQDATKRIKDFAEGLGIKFN
jgi:ATP-dependent protease HslVU (ClpYQ) peptidase subunit